MTGCTGKEVDNKVDVKETTTKIIRFADQLNYFTTKLAVKKGSLQKKYGDIPKVQVYANGVYIRIISTLFESDDAYALITGADPEIDLLED